MISQEIENILRVDGKIVEINFVRDDFSLDWDKINDLVADSTGVLDDYNECLKLKRLFYPIFRQCERIFDEQDVFKKKLSELSLWTGSTFELVKSFDELCLDDSNSLVCVLKQTTAIEHGLGNVFKSITGRSPPYLLKDLLHELSTVEEVFSMNQIFVLQLMIGSSKGVNLRNIVWHGFVDEVPRCYSAFLFVIILSYGKLIKGRSIETRQRPEINLSIPLQIKSLSIKPLLQSSIIKESNLKSFSKVAGLLQTGNHSTAIVLLLPQIESILRLIYGKINKANVTAQLGSYYVIMDSIFYEYVLDGDLTPLVIGKMNKAQQIQIKATSSRNQMIEELPRALMHLGYDLFHAPDGPRIRDRISHGESVITDESSYEALEKLFAFITSVINFHENREAPDFEYESIYMNNLKFLRKHKEICKKLNETFSELKVPDALENSSLNIDQKPFVIHFEVKTFFRPFDETQIVKLLLAILENSNKALDIFSLSCNELFRLHKERKLSSSRRQSLQHLVSSLGNFYEAFNGLLRICWESFSVVQSIDDDSADLTNVIKQLKLSLQFSENLIKWFSLDSRNFFVANEKTCDFLHRNDSS